MGQHYRHMDDEVTEAGGYVYDAIYQARMQNIPDRKIQLALIAELHGLSNCIAAEAEVIELRDKANSGRVGD